jgi:hypothetical protein
VFAFENGGNEQDEYIRIFCDSLTCRIIFRIAVRARNFFSSLNCLNDGSSDNKNTCLHPELSLLSSSPTKSAAVTPYRKFSFVSFDEH